jgi:hypothetical protein
MSDTAATLTPKPTSLDSTMPEERKEDEPQVPREGSDSPYNDPARDITRDTNSDDARGSSLPPPRQQRQRFSDFSTASDAEFKQILRERLEANPLAQDYPEIFAKAPDCFLKWRRRFATTNPSLWRRLFHVDRVLKEFTEAVPVLDAVSKLIETDTRLREAVGGHQQQQQYTIIDLCSGKGYLGMILSEILPPSKVFRIVLMDKAWPMRNAAVKPQHINWEHIYGTYTESEKNANENDSNNTRERPKTLTPKNIGDEKENDDDSEHATETASRSYYDTWPIPIDTSKQDLKSSRQLLQIQKHYLSNPDEHPVILLAIHLCGTLSLRAIDLFNTNPTVRFMALKPCCLPGMIHAKRFELFRVGNHCFEASEVCIHGKWKKKKWENGPPRSHLRPKFQKWSGHLYRGIGWGDTLDETLTEEEKDNDDVQKQNANGGANPRNHSEEATAATQEAAAAVSANPPTTDSEIHDSDKIRKVHAKIRVQHDGGFQNDFLFAERMPISSETVWHGLDRHSSQATNCESRSLFSAALGKERIESSTHVGSSLSRTLMIEE